MKQFVGFFVCLTLFPLVRAQTDDALNTNEVVYNGHLHEVEIRDPKFESHFRFMKSKVIKMYPYAQYSKDLLYEFNKDILGMDSKRKERKLTKETHEELKEDFKYVVLNMTETEGKVLMKLIHKETGMTVYDIIDAYRGSLKANYWNAFGKMFDQDLKTTYDPKEDWIIELIYNRIKSGEYEVKDSVDIITKDEHQTQKKELRQKTRERKKTRKEFEKAQKKANKS